MNLRDHLQAIYDERGNLTPALVVDAARNPEHPLHTRFTWDDTEAARRWRLSQASELIRTARVTYRAANSSEQQVRAFVPIRNTDSEPADYVPIHEAMADDFTAQLVLRQFQRELTRIKAQYGHLREYRALMTQAAQSAQPEGVTQ